MPMYFPDLESVTSLAEAMSRNKSPRNYVGIIPKNEEELSKARKELAEYFRTVWNDEIQALEVELSVSKDNYDQKMQEAFEKIANKIKNTFINGGN